MTKQQMSDYLEKIFKNQGFDPKLPYTEAIVKALTQQCEAFDMDLMSVSFGPHGDINVEIKLPMPLMEIEVTLSERGGCKHDLKPYHGFTESYLYCTKCPHKEYPQ